MESGIKRTNERERGLSPFPVHVNLAFVEYARLREQGRDAASLEKMFAGIKKYLSHPYRRDAEALALPCVWEKGRARLFYCAANAGNKARASLFLTPSLVNGSEIFDLVPQQSFIRWMSGRGIETYLLDWGNPAGDPGAQDMEGLVTDRLCAAIAFAAKQAGGRIYALGYCMGGTLLAAAAMQQKQNLKGLIFLAAPWDFHAGDKMLAARIEQGAAAAAQAVAQKACLPASWIQSVFAEINAERAMHKFAKFADMADDSFAARLFVATEDWLNRGADLPGPAAMECILGWYRDNKPARGAWKIAGQKVTPSFLDIPSLLVASGGDRLVPRESSLALAASLPCADFLEPSCGHIGMMTGREAPARIWEPVAAWIMERP